MRTLLQIGEIAQLLGVTPKTIRHYEKIGMLAQPERTRAGYRLYDAQDLLRLQRIRHLQALGLSLKKIRVLLGEPEHQYSSRDVLQSLDKELAAQIQALEERRNKIRAILDEDVLPP
jgi:DNA-binding transcriptional MerR regulator